MTIYPEEPIKGLKPLIETPYSAIINVPWKYDDDPLYLLTPAEVENLPVGTIVESISGVRALAGKVHLDLDTRGGFTVWGLRASQLRNALDSFKRLLDIGEELNGERAL